MTTRDVDTVAAAWRSHVPDVTRDEVAELLPIVERGHGRLRALVLAYRAGRKIGALEKWTARGEDSDELHRALGLERGSVEWHRLIERVRELREMEPGP